MIVIIVGGQYGGEGKGKLTNMLARNATLVARAGGPNSGHTFETPDGQFTKVRMVPSATGHDRVRLAIGPGALIDPLVLRREIEEFGLTPRRLTIDPQAYIIQPEDPAAETKIKAQISSTGTGTGAAAARRIMQRTTDEVAPLARKEAWLAPFLGDVPDLINDVAQHGNVLVEGTQGFGLSLFHGAYPFVTSRDTTAAAVCSELGISPLQVNAVILVTRTFPIRVGGPSGPLANEINWDDVTGISGSSFKIREYTTVTNKLRRVGMFDASLVRRAMLINGPTVMSLMHLDYLDTCCTNMADYGALPEHVREWVSKREEELSCNFAILGTGPRNDAAIVRMDLIPHSLRTWFSTGRARRLSA